MDLRSAIWNRADWLPKPITWLAVESLWLFGRAFLPVSPRQLRPVEQVRAIPSSVPVLLLAGAEDRMARLRELQEIARAIGPHGRLSVFPGAGHNRLWQTDAARYRRELMAFVRSAPPP